MHRLRITPTLSFSESQDFLLYTYSGQAFNAQDKSYRHNNIMEHRLKWASVIIPADFLVVHL